MAIKTVRIDNKRQVVRVINPNYNVTQSEVEILGGKFKRVCCIVNTNDIDTHTVEVLNNDGYTFVGYPHLNIGVQINTGIQMNFGKYKPYYRVCRNGVLLTYTDKKNDAIKEARLMVKKIDAVAAFYGEESHA